MNCSTNNPAKRRYMWRLAITMALYIAFLVLAIVIFVHYRPTGPLAWLLAVLPALAIILQIAAFGMYLSEEKDEFMRNLQVQALLWGIGATLSVTVTWGFLENFVHLRHMDLYLVYPLYCVLSGLALGIQHMRYK
jgi:multisubunit Na+/H+ antiporter MnhB subunit